MKISKLSSLTARIEAKRAVNEVRQGTHAKAAVVVSLLERAHEIRALDVEILDLERLLARISESQEAQHHRFRLGRFKIDLVVSDRKQLGELVKVLKTWREALLGKGGEERHFLVERLSAELAGTRAAAKVAKREDDPPPLVNGRTPASRWGA